MVAGNPLGYADDAYPSEDVSRLITAAAIGESIGPGIVKIDPSPSRAGKLDRLGLRAVSNQRAAHLQAVVAGELHHRPRLNGQVDPGAIPVSQLIR